MGIQACCERLICISTLTSNKIYMCTYVPAKNYIGDFIRSEADLKAVISHHLTLDFTPPTHVSRVK